MQASLVGIGVTSMSTTPAEFGKFIADETEKWAKVVKFAGINFGPLQCFVLSLGEGDETALQSRRRTTQIATPQSGDAKAAQCARVCGRS